MCLVWLERSSYARRGINRQSNVDSEPRTSNQPWMALCSPNPKNYLNCEIVLNRLTGLEHSVRVRYRVVVGGFDSGVVSESVVRAGALQRGGVRVRAEMHAAHALSVAAPGSRCYDRDKYAWLAEGDAEGPCLKIKLFCADLHQVPRNHLRYVSWNAYVMDTENHVVLNSPHWNYYIQEGVDTGIVMETNIPVAESINCKDPKSVAIQIEWLDSILLFSAIYHKYDDIRRLHCHQMKREIKALQDENYNLERKLFSYQKSISIVNSRGSEDGEASNL